MSEHRRIEDSILGRVVYFRPLIGGLCALMIAAGGYIATIKFFGDRQDRTEAVVESIQLVTAKLTTLQQVESDRIKSIEDWRNGVSDVYIRHRHE